jgi:hypothetical protein
MIRHRKLLDAKRAARPTGSPQRQMHALLARITIAILQIDQVVLSIGRDFMELQ